MQEPIVEANHDTVSLNADIQHHFIIADAFPPDATPVVNLLTPAMAEPLFATLLAAGPDEERPARISKWSQWYFALFLAPWTRISLCHHWQLPVMPEQIGVRLRPEGVPQQFILLESGEAFPGGTAEARFSALIEQHIAPICRALAALSGHGEALYWSNAGVRLFQGMNQAAAVGADIEPMNTLLEMREFADGRKNRLWQPIRLVTDEKGKMQRQRRQCCLRYRIDGESLCAACPLKRVPDFANKQARRRASLSR